MAAGRRADWYPQISQITQMEKLMTHDDLLDMLPDAVYIHNGVLTLCTTRERYLRAIGIDMGRLLACIEDNATDDDIRYTDAVEDYFKAKDTR